MLKRGVVALLPAAALPRRREGLVEPADVAGAHGQLLLPVRPLPVDVADLVRREVVELHRERRVVGPDVETRRGRRDDADLALLAVDAPRQRRVAGEGLAAAVAEVEGGSLLDGGRLWEGAGDEEEVGDVRGDRLDDGPVGSPDLVFGALQLEVSVDCLVCVGVFLQLAEDVLDGVECWDQTHKSAPFHTHALRERERERERERDMK